MAHEDVTEFYRRLESSIFFYDVVPDVQEMQFKDSLELTYVTFKLYCKLNYDLEGIPRPEAEAGANAGGKPTAMMANPAKKK